MDAAVVRRLADQLDHMADEARHVESRLITEFHAMEWTGPDADIFRRTWDTDIVTPLHQMLGELKELSHTARRNAQGQDRTSAQ